MINRTIRKILNRARERKVSRQYRIKGTKYLTRDLSYRSRKTYPNYRKKYSDFLKTLETDLRERQGKSYYKFGDGDYYFLKQIEVGSAAPGKRAISERIAPEIMEEFKQRSVDNSYFLCEIATHNMNLFSKTFPGLYPDFPAEFIYASIANRDLFRTLMCEKATIGLIGAKEKLVVIAELMKYQEYRDYLGIEEFSAYIGIPQKFACDNPERVLRNLANEIRLNPCNIYLVGVGHLKSYILSDLKNQFESIFLDVGSGIDALAGMIDTRRPYFSNWKNFKIDNANFYSNIDYLQFNYKNIVNLN